MKLLKLGLRVWLATTTAGGFLAGWAMLAHSGKPAPVTMPVADEPAVAAAAPALTPTPLPTLAPVPSLAHPASGEQAQSQPQPQLQPLPARPRAAGRAPRMRTSGS